jgi:hypothetical protein
MDVRSRQWRCGGTDRVKDVLALDGRLRLYLRVRTGRFSRQSRMDGKSASKYLVPESARRGKLSLGTVRLTDVPPLPLPGFCLQLDVPLGRRGLGK